MTRHTAVVEWSTGDTTRADCGTDAARAAYLVQQAGILRDVTDQTCEALGMPGRPVRALVLVEEA